MADNLIFSVNCVLPLFVVLSVGFVLRNTGVIDPAAARQINGIVFKVGLPVTLFRDISTSVFMDYFDLPLVIFSVAVTVIVFLLLWVFAFSVYKDKRKAGSFIQGSYRGNYVLLGLPLLSNVLGYTSGKALLITAFTVPLSNVLSVAALTAGGSEDGGAKGALKNALVNIVKNPVIIGITAGIPFSLLKVKFPVFVSSSINYLASFATPLALLSIGAALTVNKLKSGCRDACLASAMKLAVMPVIFLFAARLLGFTGESFVVLFVMLAVPAAVSGYVMADNMNCDSDLAANIVTLTTLFSVFTITIGIYIIKTLGII